MFTFGKAFITWKIVDARKENEVKKTVLYRRIREAAEQLGQTYVKLEQIISAAEGVIPDA